MISSIVLIEFCILFFLIELSSNIGAICHSYFQINVVLTRKIFHEAMAIVVFVFFNFLSKFTYTLLDSLYLGVLIGVAYMLNIFILLSNHHFNKYKNTNKLVFIAHKLFKNDTIKIGGINININININCIYSEAFLDAKVESRLRVPKDYLSFLTSNAKPGLYVSCVGGLITTIMVYCGSQYCDKLAMILSFSLFGDGFGVLFPQLIVFLTKNQWKFHFYSINSNNKTLEGSFGIFISSFVFLCIIYQFDTSVAASRLAVVSFLYMVIEGITPKNMDNPFLMLFSFFVFAFIL